MAKKAVFGPKKGYFWTEKRTKSEKIDFSLKLHLLHILAKFKQIIAKKSKNMAKMAFLAQKKGDFWTQKRDQKCINRLFTQTSLFTLFSQI